MSAFYTRRRRSQSFGSYGSYKEQESSDRAASAAAAASAKPELIEGYAHMCFGEQALWFRGIMLTTTGTSYNLSGRRSRLIPESNPQSPDVIRDFPLRSQGSIDFKTSRASSQISIASSLPNSTDWSGAERCSSSTQLHFILEEMPLSVSARAGRGAAGGRLVSPTESTRSLPVSRPGSPPNTEQIARALDNLLIHDYETVMEEEPDTNDNTASNGDNSPVSYRSRSGSRSHMETTSITYDVTISDLEEGTQHTIRGVNGRSGNTCTLRSRQLCFATERSFWGQRADMVIQKQLAAPDLVGQGCHVFAGPMRFYYNPISPDATSSKSSLNNWCW